MADHGEVEYATATGNDYNEHEGTYESFLHLTFVGIANAISVVLGLTLGGVLGHWVAGGLMIVLATIAALQGLFTGTRGLSVAVTILGFILLALYGLH